MVEHSMDEDMFKTDISNSQLDELIKLRGKFQDKKYKYNKALDLLAFLSGISETAAVTSSISAAATIIRNFNSIGLDGIYLPNSDFKNSIGHSGICLLSSVSCSIISASSKGYQKKLKKVMALCYVVKDAITVFDNTLSRQTSISRMEFENLCDIYHKTLEYVDKLNGE